ncbi:MAG: PAS domain S-box protein [Phormidium tanganyikae FI6-MK23]|jgi:PAS domain S-box-containing protein|nr:PAS domain S-box protein [Phormidium tanganyikae FI6-MK23]
MELNSISLNGERSPSLESPIQAQLKQLAAIVESMSEAFFTLDLTGCCTYVNQTAERLLGADRTTLIGKTIWNLFCADTVSGIYQQCHRAMIEQRPVEFEEFYPILDQWFTVRLLPAPSGLSAYFQDISDRKRVEDERKDTEAALRKEQEFLKVLLDNVQAGIVACDAEGQLKLFNKVARSFHGMPEQPLPPEQWADQYGLFLPDGKTQMSVEDIPLYRALQGQRVRDVEMMIIPKQGTARLLLANGQAIEHPDGEKQGAVVVMHDITERKQIEDALRDSEAQLSSIFQTIPDGITILNLDGQIIAANSAAEQVLGLTHSAITERAYDDLSWSITTVDGKPFPPEEFPFVRVMQTGKPIYNIEHAIAHPDGTKIILSVNASPLFDAEGRIINVITAISDITQRKQTDEERMRLIQEQTARTLAETAQCQSAFLAKASEVFASSLDYERTLQSVARLAVPYFADWCCVDLLNDDGSISRVAVVHSDPEKVQFGWKLAQRFPRHLEDGYGISQVMKTGQSEIAIDITDEQLAAGIPNSEYLEILREVGLKSGIVAPLQARGRVLGSISFVFTESNRQYSLDDLDLAEDLARRAAIAIDNARLYHMAQQAKQAAEKSADRTTRLQMVTAALSESLTPEQVAEVIVEQSMATLEATAALVVLVSKDRTELEIVKSVGYATDLVESWRRFSLDVDVPLATAIRTGKPVWAEALLERIARYPHLAEVYSRYDFQSWMALPLVVEGRSVAGVLLSFKEFKQLNLDDREFILALSRQCAQAISRAQLYEAERSARAEAEQANRVKDEFLAVLSHELRSPLNPILGWTRLLQTKKLDDAKVAEALNTIERNARLQAELIGDLLDVSRILQGKLSLNPSTVNLTTTIEAAIGTVQLSAEAKSIQIETELTTDVGQVLGDSSRLQQVVWNLLSNAVKFTPEGGEVKVRLERVGAQAQILISDNGKGIAPDFLPHVFEYFRQADSASTRKFGGLGLGLAIVKQIVELHGGTVEADSPGEGQGATFTVRLPVSAVDKEQENSQSTPCEQFTIDQPLLGRRVLIVDDEPDMRDLASFLLEQAGAVVITLAAAGEVLLALPQFQPDVLLSDIGMPDMDGYGLLRQIRALPPDQGGAVPAIALTAYAGDFNQQKALQAGFQRHLAKPVEPEQLIEAIVSVLGSNA